MKKGLKNLVLVLIVLGGIFLMTQAAFAQAALATGQATEYKVYITKFEVYNGTDWVTAFEGTSSVIDIAHVERGQSAGNFMSGLAVPDGTYTQVRVTPSGTFVIKGAVTYNSTTYITTGNTVIGGGGEAAEGVAADAVETTLTLSGVTASIDTLPSPITVTNGVPNYKVRVSFNVENALGLQNYGPGTYQFFPEIPVVTMSLQSN